MRGVEREALGQDGIVAPLEQRDEARRQRRLATFPRQIGGVAAAAQQPLHLARPVLLLDLDQRLEFAQVMGIAQRVLDALQGVIGFPVVVHRDAGEVFRHVAAFGRDAVERQPHGRGNMQPLGLAADPEPGFVEVLHRRRRDARVEGGGEAREPRGAILAHGGDGRGRQLDAEQVAHQRGEALFGQHLEMQEINHDAGDPGAILHRGLHVVGKVRTGLGAARRADATVGTMLGDKERLRRGEVEHLPGDVVRGHRLAQRLAAPRTGFGKMIDRVVGGFAPPQGLAGMPLLPARLLAGPFAKTADADRLLLQAVARRRFAAVATIEPKLAFQLRDPLMKLCDQGLLLRGKDFELRCKGCQNLQRGVLFPQHCVLFPQCRDDRCHIPGDRGGFVAQIVCRRAGHALVGFTPLRLAQCRIHQAIRFAAPSPPLLAPGQLHNTSNRAQALAALAPHLAQDQIAEALTASKTIRDKRERGGALVALAPHLPSKQQAVALVEALAATQAMDDASNRAFALAALAPHLPYQQKAAAVAEALAGAKAIGEEMTRATLLQVLAPLLSQDQIADALATARAIGSESNRVRALVSLASHLSYEQRDVVLAEALIAATAIGEKGDRAYAIATLTPHLSSDQKATVLAEALAAVGAIDDGSGRARELVALASHLPIEQKVTALKKALAIAKAAGDDQQYAIALAALAPYLRSDDLIAAFSASRAISSKLVHAIYLKALAPHIPSEAIGEALADAMGIGSDLDRAFALGALASYLSQDQIAEAFAAAEAIGSESYRAFALTLLAPHLSQGEIAQALADAKALGGAGDRELALRGLVPHVATNQYDAFSSLIDTVAELDRARALACMAFTIDLSAAIGGVDALMDIHRVITDTARWYP